MTSMGGGADLPCSSKQTVGDASSNCKFGTILASSVVQPCLTKAVSPLYHVGWIFLFAALIGGPTSAHGAAIEPAIAPAIEQNTSDIFCVSELILLGEAYVIDEGSVAGILPGSLALLDFGLSENDSAGLAYCNEPVRFLDLSTGYPFSFSTSFRVTKISATSRIGDGFAFVISANSTQLGGYGEFFGIFDAITGTTIDQGVNVTQPFKSIVVEFDTYQNLDVNDISDNHVSFDFGNINWTRTANASDVNVTLGDNQDIYAWIQYTNQTQQLEVRVSNGISRPISPLLSYTVDLSDVAEEYMWVGFSAGADSSDSCYYVRDWTFESQGGILHTLLSTRVEAPAITLGSIAAITVGAFVCLLGLIFIIVKVVHGRTSCGTLRNKDPGKEEEPSLILEGTPGRFTFKQLRMATGNFSEGSKLGQGGFGSVYRGVLPSGIPMAVKKINGNSTQREKEFMAEVTIVSRLRHRNLIQLLGWCKDGAKRNYLLVYELMPNGSLDKALFGPVEKRTARLSWVQRFNIVMGIATALDYLHQGWTQQVIHRDVKSSNIMLDEKWNAKLGDFGLARLIDHERTAPTTLVAGTFGYIAPEVAVSGKFTDKTDVYAFGVVVLEIACGRKALACYLPEDEMHLVSWVWQKLSEGDLLSTVDKLLQGYDASWMEVMLKVGLLCSHPNALARPTMKHAVQILSGDAPMPFIPPSQPVLAFTSDRYEGVPIEKPDPQKLGGDSASGSTSMPLGSTSTPLVSTGVSTNFSDPTRASTGESSNTTTNSDLSHRNQIRSDD